MCSRSAYAGRCFILRPNSESREQATLRRNKDEICLDNRKSTEDAPEKRKNVMQALDHPPANYKLIQPLMDIKEKLSFSHHFLSFVCTS